MSRDLKMYELVHKYLDANLGEADQLALKELLKDRETRTELLALTAIEQAGDEYYKGIFRELHQEIMPGGNRRQVFVWGAMAIAAMLLLLFLFSGTLDYLFLSKPEALYKEYYLVPSTNFERDLDTLLYDLDNPTSIVEQLASQANLTPLQHKALGAAYMELEKYELALVTFGKIGADSFIQDEALWYQSLAALKLNQLDEANRYLDHLITSIPKSSWVPQAKKLQHEISGLNTGR